MAKNPWEMGLSATDTADDGPWNLGLKSEAPAPVKGGLVASAKQAIGSTIQGIGQAAGDFLPGVSKDNAIARYGKSVVEANPTAVTDFSSLKENPGTAVAEATGNAGGSIATMLGARALGQGITAAAPFTGPAAPFVAGAGQLISWGGPLVAAALPSYGGIRQRQIQKDPTAEDSVGSKLAAAAGAGAVGAIESKFGPQEWALKAMTKEGRTALAEKFAANSLMGSVAKGAAKGAGIEGAEELAQNPIEQLAAGDNPLTAENLKDTAFSGVMGALGGGVFGAGAGAGFRQAKEQGKPAAAPEQPPGQGPIDYTPPPAEEVANLRKAQMGLDPANGPLSAAAGMAVESQTEEEIRLGKAAVMAQGEAQAQQIQADIEALRAQEPGIPYEPAAAQQSVEAEPSIPEPPVVDPGIPIQDWINQQTGIGQSAGVKRQDFEAAAREKTEPRVILDEQGRPTTTDNLLDIQQFETDRERREALRVKNVAAGERLKSRRAQASADSEQGSDVTILPLSVESLIKSGATLKGRNLVDESGETILPNLSVQQYREARQLLKPAAKSEANVAIQERETPTSLVRSAVSDAATQAIKSGLSIQEGKAAVEKSAQEQITRSTPDLVRQFADAAAKDPAIMRRVAAGTPEQMETAMTFAVPVNTPHRDRLMRNSGFVAAMQSALRKSAAQTGAQVASPEQPKESSDGNARPDTQAVLPSSPAQRSVDAGGVVDLRPGDRSAAGGQGDSRLPEEAAASNASAGVDTGNRGVKPQPVAAPQPAQPKPQSKGLDAALQILNKHTDGVGSPDALTGPDSAEARTAIVSALTGESAKEIAASPNAKFRTSVLQVEKLLHDAAGITDENLKTRRSKFVDWLDSRESPSKQQSSDKADAISREMERRIQEAEQADQGKSSGNNGQPSAPNVEPDPIGLTPKQYHEARMKWVAQEYGLSDSEVRQDYDTPAARKADEQAWVDAVRQAFKDGTALSRATLDKLEEVRPGALGSFLHDFPEAKVPNGYQTPSARKAEKEASDAKRDDRRIASERRAVEAESNPASSPLESIFSDLDSTSTRKANKAKKAAAKLPQAARIDYVQSNFLDILQELEDSGKLKINC